jgi:hypothetical protein
MNTHHGACWLPTPYAPAEVLSSGAARTLPSTTPSTTPTRAGTPTRLRYTVMTWPGDMPMLFSTPMRWYCAVTAPLTTLATISTAITRPITAKATTNGSMIAPLPSDCACASSQEMSSASAPFGSARRTSLMSALNCA